MKRVLVGAGAGIILFAVATIVFIKTPSSLQHYQGLVEHISIGNVREYSIFNVIAKEKGYFTDNGLNADVKEYESGPPAVADLLAGKVDFAFASDNAGVQAIFTHPQLRIIAIRKK